MLIILNHSLKSSKPCLFQVCSKHYIVHVYVDLPLLLKAPSMYVPCTNPFKFYEFCKTSQQEQQEQEQQLLNF